MTDPSMASMQISGRPSASSYVEWSAIFAGAMLTSAIVVLMTAFGSAIGLSLVSPYHGPSPIIFYVILALWFTWITVSSFVAGGYLTGRLRRPIEGTTPHEVHVRDGAHGIIVWAVAVAIGTALATFSLSSAVTTVSLSSAVKGSGGLTKPDGSLIGSNLRSTPGVVGYEVDTLLRKDGSTTVPVAASTTNKISMEASRQSVSQILATGATQGSLSGDDRSVVARAVAAGAKLSPFDAERRADAIIAQVKSAGEKFREVTETARKAGIFLGLSITAIDEPIFSAGDSPLQDDGRGSASRYQAGETARAEVSRILEFSAARGKMSDEDRAYLVRLIKSHTHLAQAYAESRVDVLSEQMKVEATRELATAETARKGGILLAFLTAATMVLGAAAAWWGAGVGGRHRDENFDASHLTRW